MLTVKPSRKERSKGNLKKSLSFGGAMAGFAMGLGLTVSIPLYFHIQQLLKEAIDQAFDLSKWLLELARMLGIEPGENFEAELSNGYTLVVDSMNDDGSGTIILKKNGSLSTIIINIDKYGNMTSAGEVSGPGAQEIIDIINGAQDIIGEESSAIDGILDTINAEVDYTSLRIEYASRRAIYDKIIEDNETKILADFTPAGLDINDWYDMGLSAHLASKFKVRDKAMTPTTPAVWSIDLDGEESAIDRGIVVDSPLFDVENIEHVYGFITEDTAGGFEFIAGEIAKYDADIEWTMAHGSEEDKNDAINDVGGAIGDAVDEIESEKEDAADREDDMISDADEAKNDAINEAAVNDPTILDKLLTNPQTWMAAYIQTFGYTDNNDSTNDKSPTTTLRGTIKQRLIHNELGDMSENRFEMLETELLRIMQLDPSTGRATTKIKVSQLANTYNHEDAVTATLYALRFTSSHYDGSSSSEVMVAESSVFHINDFETFNFFKDSDDEHDIMLSLSEIYLSVYSTATQRQSIINMKKFASDNESDYEDVKPIKDTPDGENFDNFANAFTWATSQRGDSNTIKQQLAFEMLDAAAMRFYFEGKAILLDFREFITMMEVLDDERKSNIQLEGNWITGIYETNDTYSSYQEDVLASFQDSTRINLTKLTTSVTDFMEDTNTQMTALRNNGYTFASFALASDPEDYLATLRLLITLEHYERVTVSKYWETTDRIINNINNSIAVRSQALRDIIFFADPDSTIDINDPDSLDKIEAGAGVGGGLEDNTNLNPDQIGEITDGINDVILADLLTLEELKQVVKYTETVFIVIPDETDAFNKLKTVLDPSTIVETIPGETYSGIEKIAILNGWVDHLILQGVAVTVDSIENYVWHNDPVEVLKAGSVQYKASDGNIITEARGGITSAQYSPSLDIVISGEGFFNGTAYSVPYILQKGATETTARAIAGAENQISTSSLWTAPAWNEDLQTLGMHRNVSASNNDGIRLVKMTSPTTGVSQAWSMQDAPGTGVSDSDNTSLFFRNTTLSNDGHLYGITHAGTIFKTTQRLINPSTKAFENTSTNIGWTIHYKHAAGQGLRGVMAPTLAQWGGEDYVILSDIQPTTTNYNYGVGTVDGQMTIVSLTTGLAWKYLNFPVSFAGLSVDDAGRMIYGLTGTGKIWRIDMENLDDMDAHKEIIDLYDLTSSTAINVSDLTDLFVTQEDATNFNIAYPTQATSMDHMGDPTGVRGLFYNPSTTEITIYGNGSDLYLPNKSIELNQIFNYLVL